MLGLYRNCKLCQYKYTKTKRNIPVSQLLPANSTSLHLDSDAGRCWVVEKLPYVQIRQDVPSKERSSISRGMDSGMLMEKAKRRPSPRPKPGRSTVSPSLLKLLNSRMISSIHSLLTNRHSNCPYKTNSVRFSVARICSAFSN